MKENEKEVTQSQTWNPKFCETKKWMFKNKTKKKMESRYRVDNCLLEVYNLPEEKENEK